MQNQEILMADEKMLYQVWVHYQQESVAHLVETCQERCRAEHSAEQFNAAERHDTPLIRPPRCYYYVKPISEKQLLLAQKEKYRHGHSEFRKHLAKKYSKVLKPLTKEMVTAMVFCIETCEKERLAMLHARGGWMEGYKGHAEGIGDVTCSLFYPVVGAIALEVAIECDGQHYPQEVETFSNEHVLKSWLLNTKGSASACENRIINILYGLMQLRVQQEDENE